MTGQLTSPNTSWVLRAFAAFLLSVLLFSTSATQAKGFDNAAEFEFDTASDGQQLGCLAMNIYHEGRGESAKGRAAIAHVTMNRVRSRHYPDTICEVVWQRKQFSWTRVAPRHHVIHDQEAWQQALVVANLFMNGARAAGLGKAMHYHSVTVQPSWMDGAKLVALVGNHMFYVL